MGMGSGMDVVEGGQVNEWPGSRAAIARRQGSPLLVVRSVASVVSRSWQGRAEEARGGSRRWGVGDSWSRSRRADGQEQTRLDSPSFLAATPAKLYTTHPCRALHLYLATITTCPARHLPGLRALAFHDLAQSTSRPRHPCRWGHRSPSNREILSSPVHRI